MVLASVVPGQNAAINGGRFTAIKAFAEKGVLIFAAPGNEPTKAIMLPAAHPEVTAVTASDSTGRRRPNYCSVTATAFQAGQSHYFRR